MQTSQTSETSLPPAETLLNSDLLKRTRGESPLRLEEESPPRVDSPQKRAKNQYNQILMNDNQILMIEDQQTSEVSMIEDLKIRLLKSETKQSILEKMVITQMKSFEAKILVLELDCKKKTSQLESKSTVVQQNITNLFQTITVLKSQVTTTQKKLDLVQKSIHTAPQGGKNLNPQPPQSKEKIGSPVIPIVYKMTEEEEELKMREGYDYGLMKGNEGWTTVLEKTQEKSVTSKKEEHAQQEVIGSTTPTKRPATSFKEAVQSGKQPSHMSQAQYVAKMKKDIQSVEKPCLSLLQKENFETIEEIASMTLKIKLNTKGQTCPSDSIKRIIEEKVGIQPLSLSVISLTSFQILYKKGDTASFQKLLIPSMIELGEAKKENFQQRDINRIAQLYLRGYFKELARAALQDLPTPTVELVLARATELVKTKFQNKIMRKKWLFNIQKDKAAFQPTVMEMDRTSP
jgi:hypothetical protein